MLYYLRGGRRHREVLRGILVLLKTGLILQCVG